MTSVDTHSARRPQASRSRRRNRFYLKRLTNLTQIRMKYLLKSEPSLYSIWDLERETNQSTSWDGVRNYEARNYIRQMKLGYLCFFYHSNAKPPSIVGIMEVIKEAYPDPTAWESVDAHLFDANSTPEAPRWFAVDVKLVQIFASPIPLACLRRYKETELKDMRLLNNTRLSVQPVSEEHWEFILGLATSKCDGGG